MIEKIPSSEGVQRVTRDEVISSLRTNPEDLTSLKSFLDRREKEVRTIKDTLALNMEVAEIYAEAGLTDAAREAYEAAAEQAWQEREDELYADILKKLQELQQ